MTLRTFAVGTAAAAPSTPDVTKGVAADLTTPPFDWTVVHAPNPTLYNWPPPIAGTWGQGFGMDTPPVLGQLWPRGWTNA